MGSKSNPQELFDKLIQSTDVTPERVRQILNDEIPIPASPAPTNINAPDIVLDTAINYFKLNRK